ncbi:conserved hypothetical protein [Candidatus Liberibacter solanacearum]
MNVTRVEIEDYYRIFDGVQLDLNSWDRRHMVSSVHDNDGFVHLL